MQSCLCEYLAVSVQDTGFCCGNHDRKTSCLCEYLAVSVQDTGFCCGNHARKTHGSVEVSPDPLISDVDGVTAESRVLSALTS